jgi:hypothetical protein
MKELVLETLKVGNEKSGSYLEIDRMGTLRLYGAATTWTDKSQALTRGLLGALDKPDYDFVNLGLLFPQDDTSEVVYIIDQMDHRKALGTNIRLHIHYVQSEATQPTFKIDYKYYNNGGAIPGSFTTLLLFRHLQERS